MQDGQLHISLLGAPVVKRDGIQITNFAHRKSLALLSYLAVTGQPYSRAILAALLWGDASESNARAGLRKSLAELRKLFGPHLLITRHEVAFNRNLPFWLDVELFDQQAQLFKGTELAELSPANVTTLSRSLSHYRDEFMAGFHVFRAPVFEEWVLLERERLRLAALRMSHMLAIHFLTQAEYGQAITFAEQVLAIEPCHEEAHRLLMSLLALSGQRTAALRQYQNYCRVLADDLGLEPNEDSTALYKRIRDGDSAEEFDKPNRPQLERPSTPMIGRRREIDAILNQLAAPRCRLLTLMGPGGSGKTHLAKEIAATYDTHSDGEDEQTEKVYLISLGSKPSIESLIPALAHGVGLYFSQESHPRRQLLSFLRCQKGLLILDGCEGLLDLYEPNQGSFVDLINDILNVAPGISILATSRARLHLPSENLYPLAGMTYPEQIPDDIDALYHYDAVQLFLWRLRRIQPDLDLSSENLIATAEICRLAGGMPLEILLMANWARLLDPVAIVDQLSGTAVYLESSDNKADNATINDGCEGLSVRHDLKRHLTPIFDQSWNLLNTEEQRTLATLSTFRGGFSYHDARAISSVSMSGMMALVDQSLLNRIDSAAVHHEENGQPARFDMHDLLRDHIELKPGLSDVLEEARERHATYYLRELCSWAEGLKDGREQETMRLLDIEIVNARAAWDWAIEQRHFDLLDEGIEGLCRFYQLRYRYEEGALACRTAVLANNSSTNVHNVLLAKSLAWQSLFTSDHDAAMALLLQSLEQLEISAVERQDVRTAKALVLFIKGKRLLHSEIERSRVLLEESLAIYRLLGDKWHTAQVLGNLYIQTWESGAYDYGRSLATESMALYHEIGYLSGYAGVLGDRGIGALQAGSPDEGKQFIEESIDIFRSLGDRAGLVKGLYYHGMALGFEGQWEEADKQLQSCVSIGESYCNFYETVLIAIAIVKTHLGQYELASDFADRGLEHAKEIENQMCVGRALMALALAALGMGELDKAEMFSQEAIEVYKGLGQKTELGMALAALGYAVCRKGAVEKGQSLFYEALSVAADHKDQLSLLYAFTGITYHMAAIGQVEQAIESFSMVSQLPMVANSQWFADIVEAGIYETAGNLTAETIAAAKRRGQERDLQLLDFLSGF